MEKLQEFSKLVKRKVSSGHVDELQELTKSGKFIEEQSKEFYSVFDDAFLHIYPAFVERVNELLRPEHRIAPPDGELLNSDLRILAFMRLGIDDAQRVAQILNYSVFDFVGMITDNILLPLGGLTMCYYVGWKWHPEYLVDEIERDGIPFKVKRMWVMCMIN